VATLLSTMDQCMLYTHINCPPVCASCWPEAATHQLYLLQCMQALALLQAGLVVPSGRRCCCLGCSAGLPPYPAPQLMWHALTKAAAAAGQQEQQIAQQNGASTVCLTPKSKAAPCCLSTDQSAIVE
jgi:hypothetical protein